MRILYGITKSNMGGAQRYVLGLAQEAKKRGHEVAVLLGGDGPLKQRLEESHIKSISLPTLKREVRIFDEFKNLLAIRKILKEFKPDVFHTNSSKMGGLGALAGRLTFTKQIIFTGHGWAFNENRSELSKWLIKKFVWLTILLSHKTICVSGAVYKDVVRLPFVKQKLVVIRNGVVAFPFLSREEARKELSLEPETFVVGALSELHHIKGLDIALRAINKTKDINFVVLGDGEERQELKTFAKTLGISERVTFYGFRVDARKYLQAFDVFIMPSRSEGLPYALLEAGLAGLPIVASNVGGIPEVVEDGKSGILFAKEDYNALASALTKLKGNESLRHKLGASLQKEVQTKFSTQKMFEETFRLYQI